MKAIFEILDAIKMKKSDGQRQSYDKLYNLKNQRSSAIPKKTDNQFDIGKVKFAKPKEMMIPEGAEAPRGGNKKFGAEID